MVLRYMGVDSSEKTTQMDLEEKIELVGKIYKHTLKRAELRDELFIQLSKQTRNNPDRYLTMLINADSKKLIPTSSVSLLFFAHTSYSCGCSHGSLIIYAEPS